LITIRQLAFSYPDGTRALDGINLEIGKGSAAGIVGANGAGKSTLVSHLNGWYLPQEGSVEIDGIGCKRKTAEEIRKRTGMLFQNADDQLFTASIYEDVLFGPDNLGMDDGESRREAERLLKEFGLWEVRDKHPAHLSQGQKRFAALAAVLVMRPAVLVMDEPTADLDPRNRRKLISLLDRLPSTRVTVSHDLDFIWESCNRVFIMHAGRIVAEGPCRELLADRVLLESNGLELPLRLQG
jgi:cobalt/nickel transport system ATP-binding protein